MPSGADRPLRLCVVQLDVIPQARKRRLWEPAEPRLDSLPPERSAQDRRRLSVATLCSELEVPEVYQQVLDIVADAVAVRLTEVLRYATEHEADIVVFPEYAVPVACLPRLREHAASRAIVAGLGLIRNEDEAEELRNAGAPRDMDLVERNVSVLICGDEIALITKKYPAVDEDAANGTGPIVETLRLGDREIRVGVAVCLDYLRGEEDIRKQRADILCVPAYTANVNPFRPDAPRDHVRLFSNCARHGGSAIIAPGLANSALSDDNGVRPIAAGHEAIALIEFDRFGGRPTGFNTPRNRLVLRSEIIEKDSDADTMFGRLNALMDRPGGSGRMSVTNLVASASIPGRPPGPFAEGLEELQMSLRQGFGSEDLKRITKSHLVVAAGNRPAEVRERQARHVWQQLSRLQKRDPRRPLGAALDLYHSASDTASLVFDRNDYINRVLRPLPDDGELPSVTERYALDQRHLDMAGGDLIGWIDQVVGLWRRQSGSAPRIAEVCTRFLAGDEELRRTIPYQDPQWWRDQIGAETTPREEPVPEAEPTPGLRDDAPNQMTEPADPPHASDPPVSGVTDGAGSAPPPKEKPQPAEEPRPRKALQPRKAPQPTEVTADQLDDRVVVRWPAPADAPDVRFTVERMARPGVEPRRWTTSGNTIEDREPPAGQPLLYRIRIHLADSDVQPPRMQTVAVFTPQVAGLVASQVSDGGVMGRWQTRANLRETQVWRTPAGSSADPADAAVIPSRPDGFHDRHPPPGRHTYSVVPIYRDPESGMAYRGEYRSVDVTVVGRPPPPQLERDRARQEGISAVALRWDTLPPGVSLLLRQAPTEPAGAAGDSLTLEEAGNVGDPAADGEALGGTTAEVTLPAGCWILIPFAVAGNLAVRGHAVTVDVVPAVTLPEAIRNGPDVHVSWDWPEGLTMARVVCRAGGVDWPREVTLHEFRRHGRVTFQVSDAAEVQICGLVRREAELLVSVPATARAQAQTPTLTYQVCRVRPWQVSRTRSYRVRGPGWWSARRLVILTTDLPCAGLTVVMSIKTPAAEVVLAKIENLKLGPGRSHEVMLTLPDLSAMNRPRYMYCRAETMSGPVVVDEVHSKGREI